MRRRRNWNCEQDLSRSESLLIRGSTSHIGECQFSGFARRTEGVVRSAVAPSEKSDEALDG